jgi:hypothetical protein
MKTKRNTKNNFLTAVKSILAVFMLSLFMIACNNDDNKTATLHVRLTDAPADYQQVNIDIQSVEINSEAGTKESGWKTLTVKNGVYNLLDLSNGLDTLLATAELPVGKVSQIRLILGTNNTIKVGGAVFPLSTPSAQQSGLKLNVNAQLNEGITYTILLDFDAALSVKKNGNGTYSLKPVITAISEATSGAIKGNVTTLSAAPAVFIIQGIDTLASTYTDNAGNFFLKGVPAGTYSVSFSPTAGYASKKVEGVNVTLNNVTSMGTIIL